MNMPSTAERSTPRGVGRGAVAITAGKSGLWNGGNDRHARSDGRHILRDAMRAFNRASGGNSVEWVPKRLMATGGSATGTTALATLYAAFAARPAETDLPALFARPGVQVGADGAVVFDESAFAGSDPPTDYCNRNHA